MYVSVNISLSRFTHSDRDWRERNERLRYRQTHRYTHTLFGSRYLSVLIASQPAELFVGALYLFRSRNTSRLLRLAGESVVGRELFKVNAYTHARHLLSDVSAD